MHDGLAGVTKLADWQTVKRAGHPPKYQKYSLGMSTLFSISNCVIYSRQMSLYVFQEYIKMEDNNNMKQIKILKRVVLIGLTPFEKWILLISRTILPSSCQIFTTVNCSSNASFFEVLHMQNYLRVFMTLLYFKRICLQVLQCHKCVL